MTHFESLCARYETLLRSQQTEATQREMAIVAAEIRTEEKLIKQRWDNEAVTK